MQINCALIRANTRLFVNANNLYFASVIIGWAKPIKRGNRKKCLHIDRFDNANYFN